MPQKERSPPEVAELWRDTRLADYVRGRAKMEAKQALIPSERIEKAILLIRGQKVMLDRDLAALYGVPTKRLNEQVRRNQARFPEDFMFQLNMEEFANWR